MSDNKLSNMILAIKPTTLGQPKADLSLTVAKVGARLFRAEDGEIKVPRKRQSKVTWPEWFAELEAPKTLYIFLPDPSKPEEYTEVTWNEETELFEGPTKEDGTRDSYTGQNVMEVGIPDARKVEGTPEAINKLHASVAAFQKATGKKLVVRHVQDKRDAKSGRTIEMVREVYRTK